MGKYIKSNSKLLYIREYGKDAFYPIACITDDSISTTSDMISTTTRDNMGWTSFVPGNQSFSVSFNGLLIVDDFTDTGYSLEYLLYLKTNKIKVEIMFSDSPITPEESKFKIGPQYYGTGYITSLTEASATDEYINFSGVINGTGVLSNVTRLPEPTNFRVEYYGGTSAMLYWDYPTEGDVYDKTSGFWLGGSNGGMINKIEREKLVTNIQPGIIYSWSLKAKSGFPDLFQDSFEVWTETVVGKAGVPPKLIWDYWQQTSDTEGLARYKPVTGVSTHKIEFKNGVINEVVGYPNFLIESASIDSMLPAQVWSYDSVGDGEKSTLTKDMVPFEPMVYNDPVIYLVGEDETIAFSGRMKPGVTGNVVGFYKTNYGSFIEDPYIKFATGTVEIIKLTGIVGVGKLELIISAGYKGQTINLNGITFTKNATYDNIYTANDIDYVSDMQRAVDFSKYYTVVTIIE